MAVKITAPQKFTGEQVYGPNHIHFTDGVATVQSLPWAVEAYMREAGYEVEDDDRTPTPEPVALDDGGVALNPPDAEPAPTADPAPEPGPATPAVSEVPKRRTRASRKPASK